MFKSLIFATSLVLSAGIFGIPIKHSNLSITASQSKTLGESSNLYLEHAVSDQDELFFSGGVNHRDERTLDANFVLGLSHDKGNYALSGYVGKNYFNEVNAFGFKEYIAGAKINWTSFYVALEGHLPEGQSPLKSGEVVNINYRPYSFIEAGISPYFLSENGILWHVMVMVPGPKESVIDGFSVTVGSKYHPVYGKYQAIEASIYLKLYSAS